MPTTIDRATGHNSIAARLRRLVSGEATADQSAEAVLEHIEKTERRIAAAREEVRRAVRSREGRFRL